MSYIDDIIKWFKAPKTIKGLAGMTLIIIILAVDFAWWAGQEFNVTASILPDPNGGDEPLWFHDRAVDDPYSGTLLLPSGGTVKNPGVTVAIVPFDVPENATRGFFNATHSGNAARPDLDLRIYGPDGEEVASAATEAADESLIIEYKVFNRTGPGKWTAEVDNYSSFNIGWELTIQIDVRAPLEEEEEP